MVICFLPPSNRGISLRRELEELARTLSAIKHDVFVYSNDSATISIPGDAQLKTMMRDASTLIILTEVIMGTIEASYKNTRITVTSPTLNIIIIEQRFPDNASVSLTLNAKYTNRINIQITRSGANEHPLDLEAIRKALEKTEEKAREAIALINQLIDEITQ